MSSADKKLVGVIALFGILMLVFPPLVHRTSRGWKAKTEETTVSLEKERQKVDSLERQVAQFRKRLIAEYQVAGADGSSSGTDGAVADAAVDAGADGAVAPSAMGVSCQDLIDEIAALKAREDQLKRQKAHYGEVLPLLAEQQKAADVEQRAAEVSLQAAVAERDQLYQEFETLEKDRVARFAQVVGVQDAKGVEQEAGLQSQLTQTDKELEQAQSIHDQLVADASRYQETLAKEGIDAASYADRPLPLEARVTSISETAAGRLISISVGSDQGLRRGHALEAYRQENSLASYLGRVEVVETQRDRAVCKVLPNFQRGVIQEGDRVSSQLQ